VHARHRSRRDIHRYEAQEAARLPKSSKPCRKAIYIVTPKNKILEVNPAIVKCLAIPSKESWLSKGFSSFADESPTRRDRSAKSVVKPVPTANELTLVPQRRASLSIV